MARKSLYQKTISHCCLSIILLTETGQSMTISSGEKRETDGVNKRRGKFETTFSENSGQLSQIEGSRVRSERNRACLHLFLTFVSLALMLFVLLRAHISRVRSQPRPKKQQSASLSVTSSQQPLRTPTTQEPPLMTSRSSVRDPPFRLSTRRNRANCQLSWRVARANSNAIVRVIRTPGRT